MKIFCSTFSKITAVMLAVALNTYSIKDDAPKKAVALPQPSMAAQLSIPTREYRSGSYRASVPDWRQITWGSLPPVQQPGWIEIPNNIVQQLGYNPSRRWNIGQKPDDFIMLGDVSELRLESFNLKDISRLTSLGSASKLSDFGLFKWQTIGDLVHAIPSLSNLDINQVKPVQDLLLANGFSIDGTIQSVMQQYPEIQNLSFSKLDLSQYSLFSIPGLQDTTLQNFNGWQQSFINQVPGLSNVTFGQMPQPIINQLQILGIADVVFSSAEHGNPRVDSRYFVSGRISRSNTNVPVGCQASKPCSYLELSDLAGTTGSLHGKRWASGETQQVKGGFGPLALVNNGLEPTGRLVYGSAFKVVLTAVDEAKGTADFGLYFRACARYPFIGKTCTPYFIGPIPWIPASEKSLVLLKAVP